MGAQRSAMIHEQVHGEEGLGPRRFVTRWLGAPFRNHLTYLFTYSVHLYLLTGVRKGYRPTFSIMFMCEIAGETVRYAKILSFGGWGGSTRDRHKSLDLPLPPCGPMRFGKDYFSPEAKCLNFRGHLPDPSWPFS